MGRHTPIRIAFHRPWPGTRRGLILWLLALAILFIGLFNYILTDLTEQTRDSLTFALKLSHGSGTFWGWVMISVAVLALWSSYCHFGRDRYGYVLTCVFTAAWGLGYVTGALFFDAGLKAAGGAVIWLIFSAVLATCAGFPNVRLGHHPPILVDENDTSDGRGGQ